MTELLHARVLATLETHSMVRPGDRVGVGVSGGADSVALLHLLFRLRARLGIGIVVLHFNHRLRGADADGDEAFVQQLAGQLDLEFLSDRADIAAEARRNGWNLEDAARRMRYQFFRNAARSHPLNRVAVAHTADDQAETVLAHLLRGSGPTGLAGIYPVACEVIRPLLELRRADLRAYLSGLNQQWREDATNRDVSRVRARLRHQLLPLLERDFEPAIIERLARLAGLAREDETFWRSLEDELFTSLVSKQPGDQLRISVAELLAPLSARPKSLDPLTLNRLSGNLALTRRLIRRIYRELRGSRRQLTAQHVEDIIHLARQGQSGSRIELPVVQVDRVFDTLVFSHVTVAAESRQRLPARSFEYAISCPDSSRPVSVVVSELARQFDLKIVDCPGGPGQTSREGLLDLERLRWPLILRNCRPGDSYRPRQHRGVRKLARLLLESRVPSYERTDWPVLTSAGTIVWAPQCPIAEDFAAPAGARIGLMIIEQQLEQR